MEVEERTRSDVVFSRPLSRERVGMGRTAGELDLACLQFESWAF